MTVFEDSAIKYAAEDGFYILPLKPNGKLPLTTHGLDDATVDLFTIETWWAKWPSANVGIRTGPVVVVDEDRPGALTELAAEHGETIPQTKVARTFKGRHYYFTQPDDFRVRNTAGKLAPGIDTRGDGGYVVAPPSVHPEGGVYTWETSYPIAAMPAWLAALLQPTNGTRTAFTIPVAVGDTTPYGERALEDEAQAVANAPEGTRNARLNIAAFSLGQLIAGGELDEWDARNALTDAASACGLSEREAEATIKSGINGGLGQPRKAPERSPTRTTTTQPPPQAEAQAETTSTLGPFKGLTHDEALKLELAPDRQYVQDLIPIGAVGTIAGIPETHKSWLAQAIAVRVAQGKGLILGCEIIAPATVGYFWQDDSLREEAERIKTFQAVHESPAGLPLRWFLNEGLQLPSGISRLHATVLEHTLGLVVLDSFYNFLPGVDLKDDPAERIVAQLKTEVADTTGCTILIVDHMPWATDTNRQRLRAYGGVFKNAATRFGIYIDAVGKNLSIEARGNNIKGFKKTPAYWDDDTLELHLVEAGDHDDKIEERAQKVADELEKEARPLSKTGIRTAVGGRAEITDQALELLKSRDRVIDLSEVDGTEVDSPHGYKGWIAAKHAGLRLLDTLSLLAGTGTDSYVPRPDDAQPVPSLYRDRGMSGQGEDLDLDRPAGPPEGDPAP